ncbi:tRNA1(Val) (adenine(37)-N6)-methyltransferase [Carboxydothermus pertinax]|uniref:Methyltransferase small domain-containing protein n=1 Tax=Carboxydothermus pertinax TaxID=870242 RepID=A0A1L8CVE9_9THEO|nr:tRNA1(Val) (adenine(37)-N6)-methyltransferase [Carboxydothermus pertinax]GAV22935.1 hypothetical protein cpu_14450 [Carboxydothermus pertinax]
MTKKLEKLPPERVDDLKRAGLKIYQNPAFFCFAVDSVLLAWFTRTNPKDRVVDLGTGNGVIPLLLYGRNPDVEKIYGIEIQEKLYELAVKSVALNNLQAKIEIVLGDLKEAPAILGSGFDVVTANPPYRKKGDGRLNPIPEVAIARHELLTTLEEVVAAAAKLLKPRGAFYLVHIPERMPEIFLLFSSYGLNPEVLLPVQPRPGEKVNLILLKAVKGSRKKLVFNAPLWIYEKNGEYSEMVRRIFEGEE